MSLPRFSRRGFAGGRHLARPVAEEGIQTPLPSPKARHGCRSRERWGRIRTVLVASVLGWGVALASAAPVQRAGTGLPVLKPEAFSHYVERFNAMEDENWTNAVPNSRSWGWVRANAPLFECPDSEVEEIYYFRWWSFRKHLVQTANGYVLTEFLVPMKWGGVANTMSCAVGHHLDEGRWMREQRYLDDYTRFWLRGNEGKPQPHFHKFSNWFAAAVYDRYLVNQDRNFVAGLANDLAADYRGWEHDQRLTNGLFWQFDVRDGMEESISGSRTVRNARPTINSYMYANAQAIAAIALLANQPELAQEFRGKAATLKRLVRELLWNPGASFFEARRPEGQFADVREELGFILWRFELPAPGYEQAWAQFADPEGFRAPFGLTTAERRHPAFRSHGCCKCEWDGPVWPYATSQTLRALANVLRDYSQSVVTRRDYFDAFLTYVRAQHFDGKPYIGEYLDEVTGQWLKGKQERSRYYNHSTFADLVVTGIVGLIPREDSVVEIKPMLPADAWEWFCLDGVTYHGQSLTILWDRQGTRYGRGAGLTLLVNGKTVAHGTNLDRLAGKLP